MVLPLQPDLQRLRDQRRCLDYLRPDQPRPATTTTRSSAASARARRSSRPSQRRARSRPAASTSSRLPRRLCPTGTWATTGSLDFNFTGTYVDRLITTILAQTYDCAGLFGTTCGTPTPKWRHQFRVSLEHAVEPDAVGRLALSSAPPSWTSTPATRPCRTASPISCRPTPSIPAFSYFDLSFHYKLQRPLHLPRRRQQHLRPHPAAAGHQQLRHLRPALRQRQHLSAGVRSAGPGVLPGPDRRLLIAAETACLAGRVRFLPGSGPARFFSSQRPLAPGACPTGSRPIGLGACDSDHPP